MQEELAPGQAKDETEDEGEGTKTKEAEAPTPVLEEEEDASKEVGNIKAGDAKSALPPSPHTPPASANSVLSLLERRLEVEETSEELSRIIEAKVAGSPLILSVLGHLVLFAAQGRDFSLLPMSPTEREQVRARLVHLKDPDSFHASLRQVGWLLFLSKRCALHGLLLDPRFAMPTVTLCARPTTTCWMCALASL